MELIFFLLMVGFISLSGVLMPGPVFAAAVVKGVKDKHAGVWIAVGHMIVEIPLILIIAAGFYFIFTYSWVKIGIGIVGGAMLLFMGLRMVQLHGDVNVVERAIPGHAILAGIITTVSNPYFILWWATVGASLTIIALGFGIIGIISFIVIHEACDLSWDWFVSNISNVGSKLWQERFYRVIFVLCGIFLAVLGVVFMVGVWL
jgi:threonine/homoserine/homoserine lactone efflux protein